MPAADDGARQDQRPGRKDDLMNQDTSEGNSMSGACPGLAVGERARLRAGALAAAVAGIALLAAACSGGGSARSAGPEGKSNFDIALTYAGCMRSHGAPGWPDPRPRPTCSPLQRHSQPVLLNRAS
jgi:hypothetical protein